MLLSSGASKLGMLGGRESKSENNTNYWEMLRRGTSERDEHVRGLFWLPKSGNLDQSIS